MSRSTAGDLWSDLCEQNESFKKICDAILSDKCGKPLPPQSNPIRIEFSPLNYNNNLISYPSEVNTFSIESRATGSARVIFEKAPPVLLQSEDPIKLPDMLDESTLSMRGLKGMHKNGVPLTKSEPNIRPASTKNEAESLDKQLNDTVNQTSQLLFKSVQNEHCLGCNAESDASLKDVEELVSLSIANIARFSHDLQQQVADIF